MVRDGQPGKAQLYGTGNQLVRSRSTVEEREVGVAVEFRVSSHRGLGLLREHTSRRQDFTV
jgi:hypothetical protein